MFWGSCYSIFSFYMYALQIAVCPFVPFLFAIVLSVLFRLREEPEWLNELGSWII